MDDKWKLLDDLVESVFAVEIGLSEEACREVYTRMLKNTAWRVALSAELRAAFSDDDFSWTRFFTEHDLYSAENEDDARKYAEKIFLLPLE